MRRISHSLFLMIVLLGLVNARPIAAQESTPPMLVVTIRDSLGNGIAGILIVISDRSGATEFARATTDSSGRATIATLPYKDIRVNVRGQTPSGQTLRMAEADAAGIAVTLTMPPNQLDLRVEPNGTVIPDPATMMALESGVPVDSPAAIPTAPLPTSTSAVPTITVIVPESLAASTPLEVAPDETNTSVGVAIALLLTSLLFLLLFLLGRWRLTG